MASSTSCCLSRVNIQYSQLRQEIEWPQLSELRKERPGYQFLDFPRLFRQSIQVSDWHTISKAISRAKVAVFPLRHQSRLSIEALRKPLYPLFQVELRYRNQAQLIGEILSSRNIASRVGYREEVCDTEDQIAYVSILHAGLSILSSLLDRVSTASLSLLSRLSR